MLPTYDLPQEDNVLSPDDKDSSRDVSIPLAHVDPLHRLLQHQVGYTHKHAHKNAWLLSDYVVCNTIVLQWLEYLHTKLINASEKADQRSSISEQDKMFFCQFKQAAKSLYI